MSDEVTRIVMQDGSELEVVGSPEEIADRVAAAQSDALADELEGTYVHFYDRPVLRLGDRALCGHMYTGEDSADSKCPVCRALEAEDV